jgi:hypothetical protein
MSADAFPVRFGRDMTQASPTVNDLWLPQYGGEVLAAFDENLVAKDIMRMIPISQGNSMEFPMIHKMAASRHAAGQRITGQDVATGKRVITLDERPLFSAFEIDDVDVLKAHYEVRAEMAKQAGVALARELDINSLQLGINTARTAADAGNSVFNGGGYNSDPTAALTGADWTASGSAYATDTAGTLPDTATSRYGRNHALTLLKAAEEIAISWDDRDIPGNDRNLVVSPSAWHAMKNLGLPADKATVATIVGYDPFKGGMPTGYPSADAVGRREVLVFNDFKIWRSPNLPKTNITDGETKYRGDFRKVRALAIQKNAVGLLTLLGVKTETSREVREQVNLFVTKMLYGGGALRPECAVTIAIS